MDKEKREEKFTPGPWGFYLTENTGLPHDASECIVINTIGLQLPSIQPAICILTDRASYNDRDRANGLLISAAPDMYAALEAYIAETRCFTPVKTPLPNPEGYAGKWECTPCGKCTHCKARAALAKARGEAE